MNNFLEKIRNLPENQRKIILWATVIILGLIFLTWYFKNIKFAPLDRAKLQDDLKLQDLKDDLKKIPPLK
jgi:hypothetical protein